MLHRKSILILVLSVYIKINAVPPEACFAKFRWEDCGRPPRHVLYYWKPGSRCEVGIWRGCLPNINMFHDEYECVATCIFTARAQPPDYHVIATTEEIEQVTEVIEVVNVTSNVTDNNQTTTEVTAAPDANATTTVSIGNETSVVETNVTSTTDTNTTVTDDKGNGTAPAEANTTSTNSTA